MRVKNNLEKYTGHENISESKDKSNFNSVLLSFPVSWDDWRDHKQSAGRVSIHRLHHCPSHLMYNPLFQTDGEEEECEIDEEEECE